MRIEEITSAALQLDPDERARLARTLLSSLEELSSAELTALWLAEAVQRDEEMAHGGLTGRSAEDVLQAVRQRMA